MRKLGGLLVVVIAGAACTPTTQTVSALDADGCTVCHTNITNAHTKAPVLCTSCHGQNPGTTSDQLTQLIGDFKNSQATYGSSQYQALLDAMHVHPKDGTFFLANGETGDTGACFNAATTHLCNLKSDGTLNATALGTVDDAIDSEYTRDVNYVRFINPGDLRVAHASCGGGNPQQGDYPGASGGCHAEEVLRMRRSIMVGNSSVVTAAYMGNRGTATAMTYGDPRGYMFELDSVDQCFIGNSYDKNCLLARQAPNGTYPSDEPVSPMMPENQGMPGGDYDVFPGAIQALNLGGMTLTHQGYNTRLGGIGGQPLDGTNHPRSQLSAPDNFDISVLGAPASVICNMPILAAVEPVDAILRGFRAYYPLWLSGTGHNFNAVAGNTLKAAATHIASVGFVNSTNNAPADSFAFNPFGRGHASGCTGCHMLYDDDGHNHEADQPNGDPTIKLAGREPTLDLIDGAPFEQQGVDVEPDDGMGHKQARYYPSRHQLTSRIPTRQCGLCHTFVTRIDLAYQGVSEVEEKSTLARNDLDPTLFPSQGDITFTTAQGTHVRILDSLERVTTTGDPNAVGTPFTVTSDQRYLAYYAAVKQECTNRNIDCHQLAIYSADFNDNGELDSDEHFADSITGGELWLPDRIPRDSSVDGRQVRIIYGGPNGSTHLKDVHFQKGMHCADCHFYQDVHGDGNIYTDNWEQIEVECEDCHGFAKTRAQDLHPGQLLTSGPNGRNDMMKQFNDLGQPFFFVDSNGVLNQRSRFDPTLTWQVSQVADAMPNVPDPSNPDNNPHSDKHIPTGPGDPGKLECYACHNMFAMNCLACHYQENFNQGARQQKEVFETGGVQSSHTNFQLFGMVRGPLVLAINGDAENHRIAPFRSTMEAYVGIANCQGDQVANFVTHSNCVEADNRGGAQKVITGGTAMNNFMPHSVGNQVARGCETCHPATNGQGHVVNNHITAQTMGLGTGRLDVLGDWLFVASTPSASQATLDVVDIKNESELADTSKKNSFPGFVVGANNDGMKTLLRSFAVAESGAGSVGSGFDVTLVRGFNGQMCTQEQLLNPDIAAVAAGTGGLQIFDVSLPDGGNPAATANFTLSKGVQFLAGTVLGVDHSAPDIADPLLYVADQNAGLEVVDLTYLSYSPLAPPSAQAIPASAVHLTGNWPAGVHATGVHIMGNTAAVAAGADGLVLVDVTNPSAPSVIGAPFALCGQMSCSTVASRVISQGTIAYLATTDGLAAVDISTPSAPKLLSVTSVGAAAEDVALSGHLAFVAAGTAGLVAVDVTDPSSPQVLTQQPQLPAGATAHGVAIGIVPTQTWAFVAADTAGVQAVNVSTLYDPYRGRNGQAPSPVGNNASLTIEARDPMSPRDTTVATDSFPIVAFKTVGAAVRIARGLALDRLVDESGRRLRDQWNPGSNVLSLTAMNAMRSVSFPYTP